jgi:required for meiotic nuclear division protein 1
MRPSPLSAVLFRRPCICNVRPGRATTARHILATRTAPHRGYASESTTPRGSLKPKAHTSLRRTAFDSLSIRANPKPTQSEIQPILTLATSERYLLTRLRTRLPPTARPLHDAYWVPKWSSGGEGDGEGAGTGTGVGTGAARREGEVFIFSNGSFVCWGLGEEDARRFRRDVLTPARAEVGPLAEPETEELEFATDPSECVFIYIYIYFQPIRVVFACRKTRLQGDLIILGGSPKLTDPENLPDSLPPSAFPQETVLTRYAFSQALSRSTALSALEASLEDYLSSMSSLPLALEKTGKPGMGRRALVKKLGELLRFRQGLNLNRENFSETPDFYWDHPVLEGKRN